MVDLSKMSSAGLEDMLLGNQKKKEEFLVVYRKSQAEIHSALVVALDKEQRDRMKNPVHAAKSQKVGG